MVPDKSDDVRNVTEPGEVGVAIRTKELSAYRLLTLRRENGLRVSVHEASRPTILSSNYLAPRTSSVTWITQEKPTPDVRDRFPQLYVDVIYSIKLREKVMFHYTFTYK